MSSFASVFSTKLGNAAVISLRYGIVMFFNKDGFRAAKLFHSSISIFPSPLESASSNVLAQKNQINNMSQLTLNAILFRLYTIAFFLYTIMIFACLLGVERLLETTSLPPQGRGNASIHYPLQTPLVGSVVKPKNSINVFKFEHPLQWAMQGCSNYFFNQ